MKWKWILPTLFFGVLVADTIDDVVIPRKTTIFINMGRSINSKTARPGDKFFAHVSVPVTMNDQVVIPEGSYVLGTVVFSERAGRVKGKSHLQLNWDTVILPDGLTRNIQAVVATAEGYISDKIDEKGTVEGAGGQGGEVAKGATKGGTTGGVIGGLGTGSWKGAGVGAAIGGGAGALLSLFQRGDDVVLAKGAALTIQLEEDVRFVKPAPPPEEKLLKIKKDN